MLCLIEDTDTDLVWITHTQLIFFFHISAQNIDCGYSLEPPRRGGSNENHNLCFEQKYEKKSIFDLRIFIFGGFYFCITSHLYWTSWQSFIQFSDYEKKYHSERDISLADIHCSRPSNKISLLILCTRHFCFVLMYIKVGFNGMNII